MKKKLKSLVLCGIYISVVYSVTTACPPPNCGPCKTWDSTKNECVLICASDQCCTASGCVKLDTGWKTIVASGSINVPSSITSSIESLINSIPHVSGVVLKGSGLAYVMEAQERDCCKSSGGIGKDRCKSGSTSYSAAIEATLINETWSGEVSFGDLFRAEIEASLKATLNGYVQPTITVGLYESDCGNGCDYGYASVDCGLSASVSATLSACVEVLGIGNCRDESGKWTIGLQGNAYVDLAGEIKINECANCGTSSNTLRITRLLAQLKAVWMGNEFSINLPIV